MSGNIRRYFIRPFTFAVLTTSLAIALTANQTASAALVAFEDYANYQAAALSIPGITTTETIVDFDGLSPGNSFSGIGDVTFSSDFGFGVLRVWTGGQDTVSPDNYIGNGNFFPADAQRLSDQPIEINFGAARSAAGIFIVPEANAGQISLTIDGNTINVNTLNPFLTPSGNDAYFIGFVDDTGTNSITTMTLQGAFSSRYFFDNLTTFTAVGVPEPNLIFAMSALAGGWIIRRRRSKSKSPALAS